MTGATTRGKQKGAARTQTASKAPTLVELQARFQEAILKGDDAILDLIPDSSRTDRRVLLGVYRNAYVGRLVEVLAHDHPVVAQYLGEEAFAAMGRAYVAACPSNHPNARWFSHRLPEFLASSPLYGARAALVELARIERALNDAFDAEDDLVLELGDLSQYKPEQWGDLCFTPHPSAARLDLVTNSFEIWRALKDGEAPPETTTPPELTPLLVWRNGTMASARTLSTEEAMMWNEAVRGTRFSVLCELAATYADPEAAPARAAQYLHIWLTAGLLSRAPRSGRRGSAP
jgi:hypothetical protein